MGNAQVPRVEEPRVLLAQNPAYQGFAYQDVLGSYKLFKVMRCVHESEGDVVMKLFIHRDGQPDLKELQRRIHQVRDALRSNWRHPNVLPYQAMEISSQSSVLLRQHFARNLNDRIHTRPFLSLVEKKWLSFQALAAVCQAHSAGVAHGDLKTENFFISSWSHVILTDFGTFKPLMLPQDDPTEFSFFFESDRNRHRCYLAPERFEGSGGAGPSRGRFSRELAAMDIFSLGCVLSELFQDGQTLLDLPQLRAYRQGAFDLREKLSGLDSDMQDLINSMLNRDPARRKSAIEYLREWCDQILPRSFCRCLFPLSVLMLHPLYHQPDMRVALLRRNFASLVWLTSGVRPIGGYLGFRGKEDDANVWRAWQKHVESNATNLESVMHSVVSHGLQAASQWKPEAFEAMSETEAQKEAKELASCEGRSLTQPLVNEAVCSTFTSTIFDLWEDGYKRCASSGQIDEGENQDSSIYVDFLSKLCENSAGLGASQMPGSSSSTGQDSEALGIICGLVTSCAQHVLTPRARYACLDMLQLMVPLSSQETLLEQIIPYSHVLMTDPVARVKARSVDVLCSALAQVQELPSSHAPLFTEYIFPQLMSMMSGMNNEPVVLLSVARNLGTLATHAQRCGQQLAASTENQDVDTGVLFDVGTLEEALNKIVKALLEFLPAHSTEKINQEDQLISLSVSREVKIALLRNMCVLADCFGRESTHSFLLPYLISFMNDPAWEVRAAFCTEAALLPRRVGQVSTEGIIWPCYEQALLDQEERVVEAALMALTKLVAQQVLRRQNLVTVANKVAPLLVHPSEPIRNHASQVVESLASELSQVDQYVFLLPAIRPYLLMETCSLQQVVLGLKQPWVPRELYQQVLQQRNESIFDASAPLHGSLELLRPYLQPLLSRPVAPSANRAAPVTLTASKVQCLQYATVNPHIPASRSLPCCAEASTREYHSWCPVMPKSFQHPLGFLSFQAYLVKAFCLPPKVNDLGSLSFLDGTPYSMYSMPSSISSSARAETEAGATPLQDSLSQEEMADLDTVVSVTDRSAVGVAWGVGRSPPQAWRPKGQLLATLYEYAHQSGVPVVKADTTDDSRVLVTGGRDGTVKLWCCAQLESDTAPSSFYGIQVPQRDSRPDAGLRALRTIRNSKAFATASDDQVLLYRVESSRSGAKLVSRCQSQEKGAVMFIDQLDTELESLVLFAQAHGTLRGWDLRGPKDAWTLPVPPCLGLPLSVATQRLSVTVGTAGGALLLYDLRFLRPWKQWKARAGIVDLRSADVASSHGVFAALNSRCNEVALFDVSQGSCLTLFLTDPTDDKPKEALSVPSLTEINGEATFELPSCSGPGVRSLWLPPRGAQTSLLAAGVDRKVRHWSLDPERHITEAYVVTPPETSRAERPTYTSNHLGDVFVVQETSPAVAEVKDEEPSNKPSPNHRDAILDLCSISLQHDILVTAGRDGLVKLWR